MAAKKFIWLRDDNIPRRGPALKRGQEHNVADYGPGIVEQWVRDGAALFVEEFVEPTPVPIKLKSKKSTKGGE